MWSTGVGAGVAVFAVAASPAAAATVRVRAGDTLSALATRYGTTVHAIAAANGIRDLNAIYAGERIELPAGATRGAVSSSSGRGGSARSRPSGGSSVTVRVAPGETLSAIAARYHTTVAVLVRANRITDPNRIAAGARLVIPAVESPGVEPAGVRSHGGSHGKSQLRSASTTTAPPVTASLVSFVTGPSPSLPAALRAHPDRLALFPYFGSAASAYGVRVSLLEGLCWWESGWQESVVSRTGAVGVCQIEPATASFVNTFLSPGHPLDGSTVSGNIDIGAAYLAYLLRQTGGSQTLALGSYFQGLGSVRGLGLLPGTRHYVAGILACAADFAAG